MVILRACDKHPAVSMGQEVKINLPNGLQIT